MKVFNSQSGQGLIELIIAVGVITVGMFSVWALFISNFNGEQEAKARIIGVNLAREGVEAVKNIRDTNWLGTDSNKEDCGDGLNELCLWDEGLDEGTFILANLLDDVKNLSLDDSVNDIDSAVLYQGSDGFYSSDNSGTPTTYHRLITITTICCKDVVQGGDLACDDTDFANCEDGGTFNLKIGIDVESYVQWTASGVQRDITVRDKLFNWR